MCSASGSVRDRGIGKIWRYLTRPVSEGGFAGEPEFFTPLPWRDAEAEGAQRGRFEIRIGQIAPCLELDAQVATLAEYVRARYGDLPPWRDVDAAVREAKRQRGSR